MKKRINIALILLTILLLSLIIEKKSPLNVLGYKKIKGKVFGHSNILSWANYYNGMVYPLASPYTEPVSSLDVSLDYELFDYGCLVSLNQEGIESLGDGIVIYKGLKDNGYYVIIKDSYGVEYHYGNLSLVNVSLYEYIKKSDIIGLAESTGKNYQYFLAFKDGEYLNVDEVLK